MDNETHCASVHVNGYNKAVHISNSSWRRRGGDGDGGRMHHDDARALRKSTNPATTAQLQLQGWPSGACPKKQNSSQHHRELLLTSYNPGRGTMKGSHFSTARGHRYQAVPAVRSSAAPEARAAFEKSGSQNQQAKKEKALSEIVLK